jgi:heavy metal sensor kinase
MVVVLTVYATAVYVFVSRSASQVLDARLQSDFEWPREMLYSVPDGSIESYYDREDTVSSPWLQVWSLDGELLFATRNAEQNPVPSAEELAREANGRIVTIESMVPPHRVLTGRSQVGVEPVVIQVAESEFPMREDLAELLFILMLGLPLGVAAAGMGGYFLARRALAPVNRMVERARFITAERLRERLPVENPEDELGRMATVFNETLTRLESSFEQMRRFTAHASHELRTPLTAIRSVGEVGIRQHRDEHAYREVIGSMLEEVDRLAQLVDRLLMLSRIELNPEDLSSDLVDLSRLAAEVAGQLGVLAEERQQTVELVAEPGLFWVGDRMMLRQAVMNLVDNAIKYTPEGGRVTLRVAEEPPNIVLEVSDTGPGIPAGLEARVFESFYRVDQSRSREPGGAGLGLAIARWAAEVSRGRLTLERTSGEGSTFRITLPSPGASTGSPPVGERAALSG